MPITIKREANGNIPSKQIQYALGYLDREELKETFGFSSIELYEEINGTKQNIVTGFKPAKDQDNRTFIIEGNPIAPANQAHFFNDPMSRWEVDHAIRVGTVVGNLFDYVWDYLSVSCSFPRLGELRSKLISKINPFSSNVGSSTPTLEGKIQGNGTDSTRRNKGSKSSEMDSNTISSSSTRNRGHSTPIKGIDI